MRKVELPSLGLNSAGVKRGCLACAPKVSNKVVKIAIRDFIIAPVKTVFLFLHCLWSKYIYALSIDAKVIKHFLAQLGFIGQAALDQVFRIMNPVSNFILP
jgi:hypothetical protein